MTGPTCFRQNSQLNTGGSEMKSKICMADFTFLAIVFTPSFFAQTYTPPPESAGGWRWTETPINAFSGGHGS